jgi:hypothetical protein
MAFPSYALSMSSQTPSGALPSLDRSSLPFGPSAAFPPDSMKPIIVRRRALLRIRHRKRSKDAVKRTIKAQIDITQTILGCETPWREKRLKTIPMGARTILLTAQFDSETGASLSNSETMFRFSLAS